MKSNELVLSDYKFALDESAIVAITDQKGVINYVNDNFCKISKYNREELIGQDHRIINAGYHPKAFMTTLWRTIANGKTWRGEFKNQAKDGDFYWVDTTIVPFLNKEGKPFKYLSIRWDISEQKKIENEKKEYYDDLEEMIFMMNHEVRQPIVQILGLANLLDESLDSPNEIVEIVNHIKQSTINLHLFTQKLNGFMVKLRNKAQ